MHKSSERSATCERFSASPTAVFKDSKPAFFFFFFFLSFQGGGGGFSLLRICPLPSCSLIHTQISESLNFSSCCESEKKSSHIFVGLLTGNMSRGIGVFIRVYKMERGTGEERF